MDHRSSAKSDFSYNSHNYDQNHLLFLYIVLVKDSLT